MELLIRNLRQSGNVLEGGFRGILGCFWCLGEIDLKVITYLRCRKSWNRFKLRIKATITVAMAAAWPKFKIEKPT
jgi:hypothetical protein